MIRLGLRRDSCLCGNFLLLYWQRNQLLPASLIAGPCGAGPSLYGKSAAGHCWFVTSARFNLNMVELAWVARR